LGEARRRKLTGTTRESAALPDFIFIREPQEENSDILLAGNLITDIPRGSDMQHHHEEITEVTQSVFAQTRQDPDITEVGAWRGPPPANRVLPQQFADHAAEIKERAAACYVIAVRVGDNDHSPPLEGYAPPQVN
jgi:hypothetical protein